MLDPLSIELLSLHVDSFTMAVFFGRFGFLTNFLQFIKFFVSQLIPGGSWLFSKHLLHPEPFLMQFLNNFVPDEFLFLPSLLEDFLAMNKLSRWVFRRHLQDNSGLAVNTGDKIKDDGLVIWLPLERLNPPPHIKLLHIDHNITIWYPSLLLAQLQHRYRLVYLLVPLVHVEQPLLVLLPLEFLLAPVNCILKYLHPPPPTVEAPFCEFMLWDVFVHLFSFLFYSYSWARNLVLSSEILKLGEGGGFSTFVGWITIWGCIVTWMSSSFMTTTLDSSGRTRGILGAGRGGGGGYR